MKRGSASRPPDKRDDDPETILVWNATVARIPEHKPVTPPPTPPPPKQARDRSPPQAL